MCFSTPRRTSAANNKATATAQPSSESVLRLLFSLDWSAITPPFSISAFAEHALCCKKENPLTSGEWVPENIRLCRYHHPPDVPNSMREQQHALFEHITIWQNAVMRAQQYRPDWMRVKCGRFQFFSIPVRSEEHTSELQSHSFI